MLDTIQCLRTRSDIIELAKLDDNTIAMCTSMHGAKLFSLDDCSTKSNITHKNLNSSQLSISFSPNSEFMAFGLKSNIYIMHIPSKILLKTIKIDEENIELVKFDLESKYIIVTTTTGRVLQYRYDGSSLLARLYSFDVNNFKISSEDSLSLISTLAFHKNILAIGGNNGTIFTINLHSRANKVLISNDTARISSLCFLSSNNFISADTKGNLYFNSLKDENYYKKIPTGFTYISKILLMPDPNFLIVVGKEKHAAIYDLQNFKLLHNKYIEFESIIKDVIIANRDTILVALEDNSLEKVKLPDSSKLKAFVNEKAFDKAYNFIKIHPMLMATREYKTLEMAYDKIYKETMNALMNQNKDKALELTKIFKYVDIKQESIQELFKAFENYPRLKTLYIEKKYALAYTICAKYPPLQKTFQYDKMQELWKDTFKNAQRQIAHGSIANAKALLNEYVTVADKRPIIKLILNDNNNFIEFLKAIESKDFQKVEKIAKTNTLFTKIPTYKSVENSINRAVIDVQKDIDKVKLEIAIKKITKLKN